MINKVSSKQKRRMVFSFRLYCNHLNSPLVLVFVLFGRLDWVCVERVERTIIRRAKFQKIDE